ncbi:MAG: hypothetical protein BGN82_07855 [Alphaproteobacteria bacterium 65-7]|nr:MAG: hypothetical protein BGN82_07855 [Alphaproteobacteria bacterium 65-7]
MPAYEIRYRDQNGALTYTFSATCDDDGRARVLAHAMKTPGARLVEVWRDNAMIHARPSVTAARTTSNHMLKAG